MTCRRTSTLAQTFMCSSTKRIALPVATSVISLWPACRTQLTSALPARRWTKTAYGKGTFKTFGCEDDRGYLHKYSISDSIADGTTLPLYYQLAPNEMRVPNELLEKEFLSLAKTEGVADIAELNKILERAVNPAKFSQGRRASE